MLISEVENSQQLPGHTLGYVHTVELEIFFILIWINAYIELYKLQSVFMCLVSF